MLYVSFRTSFVMRRLLVTAICSIASMSQPAFGGDEITVGTFVLTDAEIASRCAASIQGHVDMVSVESNEGVTQRVPRCVATYQNMRAIAQGFTDAEEAARQRVVAGTSVINCSGQQDCIAASMRINDVAIDAHQSLVNISHDNLMQLSEITHIDLVDDSAPKPAVAPTDPRGWGVADPIVNNVVHATQQLLNPVSNAAPDATITFTPQTGDRAPASGAPPPNPAP